jgi:hypothetical protein
MSDDEGIMSDISDIISNYSAVNFLQTIDECKELELPPPNNMYNIATATQSLPDLNFESFEQALRRSTRQPVRKLPVESPFSNDSSDDQSVRFLTAPRNAYKPKFNTSNRKHSMLNEDYSSDVSAQTDPVKDSENWKVTGHISNYTPKSSYLAQAAHSDAMKPPSEMSERPLSRRVSRISIDEDQELQLVGKAIRHAFTPSWLMSLDQTVPVPKGEFRSVPRNGQDSGYHSRENSELFNAAAMQQTTAPLAQRKDQTVRLKRSKSWSKLRSFQTPAVDIPRLSLQETIVFSGILEKRNRYGQYQKR